MFRVVRVARPIWCLCWVICLGTLGMRAHAGEELSPPQFSHAAGFQPYTFKLRLHHPDAGVSIFYTLDGSQPFTEFPFQRSYAVKTGYRRWSQSADGALVPQVLVTYPYRGPVKIARVMAGPGRYARVLTTYDDKPVSFPPTPVEGGAPQALERMWDEFLEYSQQSFAGLWDAEQGQQAQHARATAGWIDQAVVVRAVAVGPQGERSAVVTRTYFFGNPSRFSLPIVALTADPQDLFDYDRGVMVAGRRFDEWRQRNPAETATAGVADANWRDDGDSAERAVHVEYMQKDPAVPAGVVVRSQAAGLRIHGAFSRASPEKSLRLHARKRYGTDDIDVVGSFARPFMPKQVVLRSSSNDRREALMRDAVAQRVVDGLSASVSRSQPVSLFLNGEYWGLFHLRERLGDDHLASMAKVKDSDIEISRNYGITREYPQLGEPWLSLVERLETARSEGRPLLPLAEAEIDIASFIDLHAAEVYVGNTDWPANNMLAWRVRPSLSTSVRNSALSKWHWAVSDMDMAFREPRTPTLRELLSSKGPRQRPDLAWSSRLFRVLITDPEFNARFVSRLQDLLNTQFAADRVGRFIEAYRDEMAREVPYHINRWGVPADVPTWEQSVRHLLMFAAERPERVRAQLETYMAVPPAVRVEVGPMESGVALRVNGLVHESQQGQITQLFYSPGTLLKLEVLEPQGCRRWLGWEGQPNAGSKLEFRVERAVSLKPRWRSACGG